MTRRILAAVLLLCLFVSVTYAQSAATVFGWPASKTSPTADLTAKSITLSDRVKAAFAEITGNIYASGTLVVPTIKAATSAGLEIKGSGDATAMTIGAGGGTEVSTADGLNVGGTLRTATGTAAAPAYTFSTDPDTGIYSAGANVLGFGVGGAEVARMGPELLIATSTDAGDYPLQNNGYAWSHGYDMPRDNRIGWFSKDDTFTLDGVTTAQNGLSYGPTVNDRVTLSGYFGLSFVAKSAESMRITNGGNVLVGTTTDDGANKLQVNGSMRLIGMAAPTATEGGIYFNSSDKHLYVYNGTGWVQLDN